MRLIEIILLVLSATLLYVVIEGTSMFGAYTLDIALFQIATISFILMIVLYKFCTTEKKIKEQHLQ